MSSRFSPKIGIRLRPSRGKSCAAWRAEAVAGRTTIEELGVMISETSRRVSATTCSRIGRVDSGSSASRSSGSSGSGWNLDLDARGSRRRVDRPGQSGGERLDQLGGRGERQGHEPGPRRRSARAHRATSRPRPGRQRCSPGGRGSRSPRRAPGQLEVEPRQGRHVPPRAIRAARVNPPTTARDSAARSVSSSSWAIASARLGR